MSESLRWITEEHQVTVDMLTSRVYRRLLREELGLACYLKTNHLALSTDIKVSSLSNAITQEMRAGEFDERSKTLAPSLLWIYPQFPLTRKKNSGGGEREQRVHSYTDSVKVSNVSVGCLSKKESCQMRAYKQGRRSPCDGEDSETAALDDRKHFEVELNVSNVREGRSCQRRWWWWGFDQISVRGALTLMKKNTYWYFTVPLFDWLIVNHKCKVVITLSYLTVGGGGVIAWKFNKE